MCLVLFLGYTFKYFYEYIVVFCLLTIKRSKLNITLTVFILEISDQNAFCLIRTVEQSRFG